MPAYRFVLVVLASALALPLPASAGSGTKAGTHLDNVATATYADRSGTSYSITSNPVTTTVAAVGSLTVGPKESVPDASSEGYAPGATIVRTFTIVNTSNVADAYVVTEVSADGGHLTSLAFNGGDGDRAVTVGGSASPLVAPGAGITLTIAIATSSSNTSSSFPILVKLATTKSQTANGVQNDWGRAWAIPARGPLIAGPGGPSDTVSLFVGGAHTEQAAPGAAVAFSVPFGNWGGSPATNPVLTVALPAAVHVDLTTVKAGGAAVPATMNANALAVALPTIPVNATSAVTFDATLDRVIPTGTTLVSSATLSAIGAKAVQSIPATIFVGTAGIVFDAGTPNALPVPGASIALVDQATSAPIALADTASRTPSVNPTLSAADGSFGFSIAPEVSLATLRAALVVHAPGFIDRRIGLLFAPQATPPLYTLTMTALDGAPLAAEGGFGLVSRPVTLTNINGLFGNIPLFRANGLTVTLAADRAFAAPGDRIIYSASYTIGSSLVLPRALTLNLAPGLAFAPGTGRLDGNPVATSVSGRSVSFDLASSTTRGARTQSASPPGHTLTAVAVVLPGTPSETSLRTEAGIAAMLSGSASEASASATADVRIIGGPFSAGAVLTGRVFLDERRSGRFEHGDHGVAGARIYLENGDSALTDAQGRFSFFGVRPGMHVVRLDPQTLPAGVRAYNDRAFSSNRSLTRLVHGTLDSGLAGDLSFAVLPQ